MGFNEGFGEGWFCPSQRKTKTTISTNHNQTCRSTINLKVHYNQAFYKLHYSECPKRIYSIFIEYIYSVSNI